MARYIVGIDLGTTNSAVAYVDLAHKVGADRVKLHSFPISQLVGPGELRDQPLLPSFLYLPGPHDLPAGAISLPWNKNASYAVGNFARQYGAKIPGRLVSSAKSWLCHPGVDRTAPLLPWGAPPDVNRLSPLEVSTAYLKHMVDAWNAAPNRKPEDMLEEQMVVLTVPASFDDVARNLTAEAAKLAGLKNVFLLEEPQAAFYAWLGTHTPQEAGQLKPGMRCLVVDVGGGTSDFSLIRAGEENGELLFEREAVGDHLLLGGDNMDLTLAKAIEAKLPGGRIDAAQFGALIQACRSAKESLLSNKPPEHFPVTVVGRGRSVVGGTVSVNVTPEDIQQALFEGFFPHSPWETAPGRAARTGLQEMGLPYVSDPAVTRHLGAFLRQQLQQGEAPDAILFNGGVFTPRVLQERLIDVMRAWFPKDWKPMVLTSPSLDLAVAWGAAYFGWLKKTGGRRIGGGIPRSYYIGIDAPTPSDKVSVLCVVPRKLLEGEEIAIKEPLLQLQLGQPVLFPLYTSTVRGDDKPGQVLQLARSHLLELPPLHTILRGGKRSGVKLIPVTLASKCTEIGTLELACVSQEQNRWRLEFNVRDIIQERPGQEESVPTGVVDVFPEERVQAAGEQIRGCFTAAVPTPPELPKELEKVLESGRGEWPTGLCRRLWDFLNEASEQRAKSPPHLARWYNLTGFSLRPGFGDPVDRYRVEALWKLMNTPIANSSAGKTLIEGGADYWIMWRRVAGGLNTPLQQSLWSKLKPYLLPSKTKSLTKPTNNELAEMWRTAASLERLDTRTKQQLGEELFQQIGANTPHYAFWALTRFGARRPFYGPLNSLVHPDTITIWIERLLTYQPLNDTDRLGWCFCLAQLARRTDLRGVDLDDEPRQAVLTLLRSQTVPEAWVNMVESVLDEASDDQSRLFGEALPIGLKLA
jgi:hypothetical protein